MDRMFEEALALLAGIDRGDFALAALAAVLAGGIRGFSGFGGAMVKAPVFAALYGPATAVALMMVMEVPALPQVLRTALRETSWDRILPLAAPALVGVPVGVWVLVQADPEVMRRAISLVVIAVVAVMASGRMPMIPKRKRNDALAGFFSGALGASTGIAGPPVILYFLGTGDAARQVRGDLFGYFFLYAVMGLVTFALSGLITPAVLAIGLGLAPFYMAGLWLGGRAFPLASERAFRRVALILLTVIGAATLLK